jgi:hypothetical protein
MARSKQEPDGVRSADIRSRDDSDVEGHAMHRGGEADGAKSSLTRSSLTRSSARGRDEGEDVEGHAMHRGGEADGAKSSLTRSSLTRSSADGGDEGEDVEGHSMLINPGVSRDLAKARDADIQRSVRAHNQASEAKRPFKK